MAFIIGICGGSGAGKTTLANRLKDIFKDDLTIIQFDNYGMDHSSLPMEERVSLNYDIPSAYDGQLLSKHIQSLKKNKTIDRPCYDFKMHTRTKETVEVKASKVIVIEGIMCFAFIDLFKNYDLRVFVDAKEETRFKRRKRRDMVERGRSEESITKQFYSTVKPMHDIYIEPHKVKSDFLFDNDNDNGLDEKQVEKLVNLIREKM